MTIRGFSMRVPHRAGACLAAAAALTAVTAAGLPGQAASTRHSLGSRHSLDSRHSATATRVTLSAADRRDMTRLYAAGAGIPASDVGRVLAGPRAARVPRDGEWALVGFAPATGAAASLFQDGGSYGVFTRPAGGSWRMTGPGGVPLGCGSALPAAARSLWGLGDCGRALAGTAMVESGPAYGRRRPHPKAGATGTTAAIASISLSNLGVGDTPASTRWSFDCNPYTTLNLDGVSSRGCGEDTTFSVKDQNQLWCADFAKYVWGEAGVADASTLTAGANSFTVWGAAHGEQIEFDGVPAVGDAVVFYPKGTWHARLLASLKHPYPAMADHVAVVAGITNGLPDLVNGDFMGLTNITVEEDQSVTLKPYAAQVFGAGEKWVVISPQLPSAPTTSKGALPRHHRRHHHHHHHHQPKG